MPPEVRTSRNSTSRLWYTLNFNPCDELLTLADTGGYSKSRSGKPLNTSRRVLPSGKLFVRLLFLHRISIIKRVIRSESDIAYARSTATKCIKAHRYHAKIKFLLISANIIYFCLSSINSTKKNPPNSTPQPFLPHTPHRFALTLDNLGGTSAIKMNAFILYCPRFALTLWAKLLII